MTVAAIKMTNPTLFKVRHAGASLLSQYYEQAGLSW